MDVTTLPQEMLANVLKYTTYEDVFKLRKMNYYVDTTVKRYSDLKKIPVSNMVIRKEHFTHWLLQLEVARTVTMSFGIPEKLRKRRYIYRREENSILDKVIEWSQLVKVICSFELNDCLEIDDSFYSVIMKNKTTFRNCEYIRLLFTNVSLSVEKTRKLFASLPNLDRIYLSSQDESCKNLLNSAVLGNRYWSSIVLDTTESPLNECCLTDDFLHKVVSNCDNFTLTCDRSNFTFKGVMDMMKELSLRGRFNRYIDIDTLNLNATLRLEMEHFLKLLPGFKCLKKKEEHEMIAYVIYFKTVPGCPTKSPYLSYNIISNLE